MTTSFFEGKNILVTGGSGFIGKNFVYRLKELGANVLATYYDNPTSIEGVEYVYADLTDDIACSRVVMGMDYVFMCAAETHGAAVIMNNPLSLVTPNVVMNTLMLDACYSANVKKFLFISSSVVYPEGVTWFASEDEAFSGDPPDIYYHVGWMKRYAEILCKMYSIKAERRMPCIVVRPANVYGKFDCYDLGKSHVVAALVRKVVERHNPIEVWGDGNDVRDVIYIDDFIEGALLAFEKLDTYYPLNIASGRGFPVKYILKTAMVVDNCHSDVVYNSDKPSTIKERYINASRAEEVLGFHAKTSLEEGLKKTIAWYRANNDNV